MDRDSKAAPLVSAGLEVSNQEFRHARGEACVTDYIHRNLTSQLAEIMTRDCVVKTRTDYTTRYEVRLYVLTPDQLHRLIERRADDLHRGASINLSLLYGAK